MVQQGLINHFKEQSIWEWVKHCAIFVDFLHLNVHGAGLVVDCDVRKCLFVIFISQVVNDLEALTDSKDGEVDTLIIFLFLHVVPNFLGVFVEIGQLPRLHVN